MSNNIQSRKKPIEMVLLTGTIASGKTTLAEQLSVLLTQRGVRHALIDLDWLGQVYPAEEAEIVQARLATHNLGAIWPNFEAAGIHFAILAATLETRQLFDAVERALPGVNITVALVTAPAGVLRDRIERRDRGELREHFLSKTERLAGTIAGHGLHSIELANDGDPVETAAALLDSLGWEP